MCNFDPQLAEKAMAPNLDTKERLKYLAAEREFIAEMLEDTTDCKWIYQSLVELIILQERVNGSMPEENRKVVQESIERLKTLDPLRKGRWLDLEESVNISIS